MQFGLLLHPNHPNFFFFIIFFCATDVWDFSEIQMHLLAHHTHTPRPPFIYNVMCGDLVVVKRKTKVGVGWGRERERETTERIEQKNPLSFGEGGEGVAFSTHG